MFGPQELMTSSKPINIDGKLCGGTHFERLGSVGKNNSRCYSLTLTQQHPRGVVGPTAGGKIYNGELNENGIIRKKIISASNVYLDFIFDKLIIFIDQH
jgi:hypothetical protein